MTDAPVPEWALRRAAELAGFPVQVDGEGKPLPWRQSLYNAGLDAFARYIAEKEPELEDHLLEEAEALHQDWLTRKCDDEIDLALAALKRGMEMRPPLTREMVREALRQCRWSDDDPFVDRFLAALTKEQS